MDPKIISIVTPNYNHGHYLSELIESCLLQSYPHWELIIVDDASTDNSLDVAYSYARKHANIRVLENRENMGAIYSVNQGFKLSRGDYVVMRSADDIHLPGYFATAVDMLQKYPHAAFFCADIAYFREDPDVFQVETLGIGTETGYYAPDHLVDVLGITPIHGHTVMIRKRLLEALGYFQESHRWYNDWLPYMSWAFRKGVCYTPQPMMGCRLLSDSFGNKGATQQRVQEQVISSILQDIITYHKDILHLFVKSQALRFFGHTVKSVIEKNPVYQEFFAKKQLQNADLKENSTYLNAGIYGVIHKTLDKQRFWIQQQYTTYKNYKIWIYGAGMHTSILLRAWSDFSMPKLQGILLSEDSALKEVKGLQVCCVKNTAAHAVNLILISSKSYEQEILTLCKAKFPDAALLTFWDRTSTKLKTPISKHEASTD